MINGAHAIIHSTDVDKDRAFLQEVLELPHVDVGHGWLIFGLPPAEIAFHPAEADGKHEIYLMCDDIEAFVSAMRDRNVPVDEPRDEGWGLLTHITLPAGGRLGVYQPRHARPDPAGS